MPIKPLLIFFQDYETTSDHLPIKINIDVLPATETRTFRKKWKTTPETLYNFKQNFPKPSISMPASVDDLAKDLSDRISTQASLTLEQTSGNPRRGKSSPWWDQECAAARKERRKSWKILERHPTPDNLDIYQEKVKIFDDLRKIKKKECFHKFVEELTPDVPIGTAFKKIRALNGYKTPPDTPFKVNNEIIVTDEGKAEALAAHYEQNSTTFHHKNLPDFHEKFINNTVNIFPVDYNSAITISELKLAISKVKNTAPGEDNIPYILIKNLPEEVLYDFLYLLNYSFHLGIFPTLWKKGLVFPIFKPNKPKDQPSSFRPITLLSCLGKIYERIINSRLQFIIEEKKLLSPTQSGFRNKRGTMDTLLQIEQDISDALGNKKVAVFVYVDLQSAFDSIWGEGLIYKMMNIGIKGNLLKILHNFFDSRENKVIYNNKKSNPFFIQAGTPQGSVLSPTLFNLMLQDIPTDRNIQTYTYADDITISSSNRDHVQARDDLQNYLNSFLQWTAEWGLRINPQKSVMQYFTRKHINIPNLTINNVPIIYKSAHRVLGMILDSPKLTWKPHIEYLINDAQRRMNILKIISSPVWGASLNILRQTYISYIRSKIAYGSILYESASDTLKRKLEIVQNTGLRLILGARKTSPIPSLQVEANIPPLTLHRGYLVIKNYCKLISRPNSFLTKKKLQLDIFLPQIPKIKYSFTSKVTHWLSSFRMDPIQPTQNSLFSPIPPWKKTENKIIPFYDYKDTIKDNNSFISYINTNYPGYKLIYTDGSKTNDPDSTACGIFVQSRSYSFSWKLDPIQSVLASELYAIYKALELASFTTQNPTNYVILSDSKTALLLIKNKDPQTHQSIVYQIQRQFHFLNTRKSVVLHWVKGHAGITGNEKADKAANDGHKKTDIVHSPISLSIYLSQLKKSYYTFWERHWKETVDNLDIGKFLFNIRNGSIKKNDLIFKQLNRREQVLIQRLRIGHAGVQAYLNRFNIIQEDLCLHCHSCPETLDHFFFHCPEFIYERATLENKLDTNNIQPISLRTLFAGNPDQNNFLIIKAVLEYVKDCGKHLKHLSMWK